MKLIIDIPRKVNEHIRSWYGHGYFPQNEEDRNIIAKAIYDSTPIPDNATVCDIEQIRNEVQRMADSKILNMKIVLELIDKYTKGDKDEVN